MTSATTGHATCRRGNSVWPSTTLTMARAMRSRARIPRRRRASRSRSGHPGTPMAMAPVVYCLWQEFLRFDPDDPIWPNRDRFVLSMGHASLLLYSMLALAGVKAVNAKYERLGQLALTLDDIKRFRQLDSRAPG